MRTVFVELFDKSVVCQVSELGFVVGVVVDCCESDVALLVEVDRQRVPVRD